MTRPLNGVAFARLRHLKAGDYVTSGPHLFRESNTTHYARPLLGKHGATELADWMHYDFAQVSTLRDAAIIG